MIRRVVVLCLIVFLVCTGIATFAEEESPNRVVSERLIGQTVFSWILQSLTVSPDGKHVAYMATEGDKQFVVVDEEEAKKYDDIGGLIFSPDSKRVAYMAGVDSKQFVVVDGREEKKYDDIGGLIFSPDSKRLAYVAIVGNSRFVVVDGQEGKKYDSIITTGGGRVIFDSPDNLHYLVLRGNSIYLVTERIE